MFSCFQLTSPHQQPSAFLRPGVKTATGGGGGWGGQTLVVAGPGVKR